MIRILTKSQYVILTGAFIFLGAPAALAQQAPDSLGSLYKSVGTQLQSGSFKVPFSKAAENNAKKQAEDLPNLISVQRVARYQKPAGVDSACIADQSCIVDWVELEMTIQDGKEQQKLISIDGGQKHVSVVEGDLDDEFKSRALNVTGIYLSSPTIPFSGGGPLKDLFGNESIQFADGRQMSARRLEFDTGNSPFFTLISCDGSPDRKIPGRGKAWFDPNSAQLVKLTVQGYGSALEAQTSEVPSDKCPAVHFISQDFEYANSPLGDGNSRWLPKISAIKMGPSDDNYLLNYTQYVSYKIFTASSTISFSDEKQVDTPDTKARPAVDPFSKKPSK